MSKLVETYSRTCGLKISEPFLQEKFYPLNEKLYFTIQGSSGQEAKCYDYYSEVIDILSPFLKANNISVIQLGGKDDKPIPGCVHLMGVTSLAQSYYILARGLMHIGNDSWLVHAAGFLKKPVVALYGSTSSWVHGPYFCEQNQTILIDSHRNGNLPTYSGEQSKTVNKIKPEEVANAILINCGLKQKVPQDTYLIGQNYKVTVLEYVPNFILHPSLFPDAPISVRMDYFHSIENLVRVLSSGRKVNIFANQPIDVNILNHFKANIIGMVYEISLEDNPDYISLLKQTGIKLKIITKNLEAGLLSDIRAKFFDVHAAIEHVTPSTKEAFIEAVTNYRNNAPAKDQNYSDLLYRSFKYILSNEKIYLSKAAWKNDISTQSFEANVQKVIDSPEFFEEFYYYRVFSQIPYEQINQTGPANS